MSKRAEWFQGEHAEHAKAGIKLGTVSPTLFLSYVRFITYCDYIKEGIGKEKAVQLTARETGASRSTVQRDVIFFTD